MLITPDRVPTQPPADAAGLTKARLGAATAGLFLLLLISRVLLAYDLPRERFRNYDEFLTLQIVEAPLLGLPPIFLSWPAGPVRMFFPGVLLADLVRQGNKPSVAGLLDYLGEVNRQPWGALCALRWAVMLISVASLCCLIAPLARRTGSMPAALMGVVLLAAVPLFWQRSVMAMPDAVAMAFLCGSIAVALGRAPGTGKLVGSGLLLGLAVATKITMIQAAPFVLLLGLSGEERRWRSLVTWVVAAAVGFCLGCPYGVAEPVRMIKSILGNLTMKESGAQLSANAGGSWLVQAPGRLMQLMPWWTLGFVAVATVVAVKRRHWWSLLAVSAGFLASTVLVLRSPAFTPFYLMPLAPVLVMFSALVLGPEVAGLFSRIGHAPRRLAWGGMVAVLMAVLWAGARGVRNADQQAADYYQGFFGSLTALRQNYGHGRVIVSPFLVPMAAGAASSESLLRLADEVETAGVGGKSMKDWLQATLHLGEQPARSMANHFTESDRNLATFLRVAAGNGTRPGYDLSIVGSRADSSLTRLGSLSREEAFARLKNGQADALLIDARLEADLPPGGRMFGAPGAHQYVLYLAARVD